MKLCWFHLMPYTDLPEDFRERHGSVWVDIDSRLFDPAKANAMYNDFLDELEFADAVGFDGVSGGRLAGAGHPAYLDEPEAEAEAVLEFLDAA
jgi:hypothetical protein